MIKKFLYFFDKRQKRSLLMLVSFMFIATIFEMVGLSFIFIIVGSLSPENIENKFLVNYIDFFKELNTSQIFSILLSFILIFYIIKIWS